MANDNQQTDHGILVDSKLMQNYRTSSPVSGGTQIATARGRNGNLQIFSIGTDGHIYNFWPDKNSDTGWSKTDLNINGKATRIAAVTDADGNIVVCAATSDTSLWHISDRRWGSGWQSLGNVNSVFSGKYNVTKLTMGINVAGSVICVATFVDLMFANQAVNAYVMGVVGTGLSTSVPLLTTNCLNDTAIAQTSLGMGTVFAGGKVGQMQLQFRTFQQDPNTNHPLEIHYISGTYSRVGVIQDPLGEYPQLFVINSADKSLNAVTPRQGPAPYALLNLSGSTAVTEIETMTNEAGQYEVFAIGVDGSLYHTRQDSGATTGWTEFAQINNQAEFIHMAVGQSADGNPIAFVVSSANKLYQAWQDPATSDWIFEEIELGTGAVQQIQTYSTEITVMDQNGAIRPFSNVTVGSSDPITAIINGRTHRLDAATWISGQTNAGGKVTVVAETQSLDAPLFRFTTDFMIQDECITVEPNAYIQDRLLTVQADDLLNATNQNGEPVTVLQPPFNNEKAASAVADALNQCMELAAKPSPTPASLKYLSANKEKRGLRHITSGDWTAPRRIDLSAVVDQHWQIDFSTGQPVFTVLSSDGAAALMASRMAALPDAVEFFGFDVDWGDVWDSFTNTVSEIVDVVVSTVVDAATKVVTEIKTQITLLINDIKYVFNAAVSLVEQAFDMVAGVFQKVAAAFEQVFEWLAFLFKWDDILRTKEVIKYSFKQFVPFTQDALQYIENIVVTGIDNFETQVVEPGFEQLIAKVGGQNLSQIQKENVQPDPTFQSGVTGNVVFSGFLDNIQQAQADNSAALRLGADVELGGALNSMIDELKQLSTQFRSTAAFTRAYNYFSEIKENPDRLLELLLSGLLEIVEGITLFVLDATKLIFAKFVKAIVSALDRLVEILEAEIQIPFVSDLYSYVTSTNGEDNKLTALDLMSLIIAIPGTIIYKALFNAAPFPNDDSVQTFEKAFTTQALLDSSGIKPSLSAAEREQVARTLGDTTGTMFQVFACISDFVYAPLEAMLDIQLPDGVTGNLAGVSLNWKPYPIDSPGIGAASYATLVLTWTSQYFSTPYRPGVANSPLGCKTADELGNLIWVLQNIGAGMDSVFFAYTLMLPGNNPRIARNAGDIGCFADSFYGAAHIGMFWAWADMDKWQNVKAIVGNFIGAVPEALKWLRFSEIVMGTEGFSLGALAVIDLVGDISQALIEATSIGSEAAGRSAAATD